MLDFVGDAKDGRRGRRGEDSKVCDGVASSRDGLAEVRRRFGADSSILAALLIGD